MTPIAPVRPTCVPPQAETSKPSTSMMRSVPVRADSLRRGSGAASAASANLIVTGRSAQTTCVGRVLRRGNLRRGQLAREIDRRRVGAEMEALGAHAADTIERRRQHVLAGVLLHVIEAPRPVDRGPLTPSPSRAPSRAPTLDDVHNRAVVSIDDVDDPRAAERAGVERLAAGRRIEGGAIEHDAGAAADVADVDDAGRRTR